MSLWITVIFRSGKLGLLLEGVLTWLLYWLPPAEDEPWGEKKKKKPVTFLWQNYFKAKHLEGQQYINFYFKLFCLVLKSTQNVKSSLPYFVNMSKIQCVPVHQNGCLQSPFRKEISVISLQRIWLKDRELISFRLKSALWRMTSPQKAFNVHSCRVLQTFWVLWASTITAALMKKWNWFVFSI